MQTRRTTIQFASLACLLGITCQAAAQTASAKYPDKPVKVIVALAAGGSVDMIAVRWGKSSMPPWVSLLWWTTAQERQARLVCPLLPSRPQTATR